MESRPDDDWFDKIMVFFANWSRPIAEEWFKLMGWLLIISAISFVAKEAKDVWAYTLLALSAVILFLYCYVGYHELIYNKVDPIKQYDGSTLLGGRKYYAQWVLMVLVSSVFSSLIMGSAYLFATKLSNILHG